MRQEVLVSETDVVSALRHGLAARIGRDRFELWFGSHVQWQVAGDTVVVTAPNSFVLDRLRRQFAADIRVAVETICGGDTKAEFRVDAVVQNSSEAVPVPVAVSASSTVAETIQAPLFIRRTNVPANQDETPVRRPRADLASFVVGAGSRVAHTAALSIVQRPGAVSPLFLYGPPGTGKTHLLEAVCGAVRSQTQTRRALFVSAEQFTSLFLEALQGSGLPSFRRKCREVDVLAVDDIQFFAGKRATLLEFQHTLDALSRQGRQVVVCADRAPAELSALGTELVTRLAGGLVCGIESPDYETRLAIVRQFVARDGQALPDAVMQLIAAETSGDARQIRGAIHRLRATSAAHGCPMTLELARDSLQDIFATSQRLVRLPDVERAVCEVFGMEQKSLREGGKAKSVSQPRMLAMWLARKYTRAAFSEIGEYFGRRSHSTVISAERKVNSWMADGVKLHLGRGCWPVEEAIRRVETKLRTG